MYAQIIQTINLLVDSGISPTYHSITNYLYSRSAADVSSALWEMSKSGLLSTRNVEGDREYWVTTTGHVYYDDAVEDPRLPQTTYHEWVDAALTGMNKDGGQSGIENPVVPSSPRPGVHDVELHVVARYRKAKQSRRKVRKRYPKGG